MPYNIRLQQFTLPEFEREAPESWTRRLREFSPITDQLTHLRFRWMEPHASWGFHERGLWLLYSCTPRALVTPDRAQMFERHWSELPQDEQVGRKALVSDYQHFLWHTVGVDGYPFWILQGEAGGTPAKYTRYEQRVLDGEGLPSEAPPLGSLPACPFDERAVVAIQKRDRLFLAGNDLDALLRSNRPDALRAADDAAEKAHRARFLDFWFEQTRPQADFLKWYLSTSESDQTLPKASRETANAVTQWKDHYIEHGHVLGAGGVTSKAAHILVPTTLTS